MGICCERKKTYSSYKDITDDQILEKVLKIQEGLNQIFPVLSRKNFDTLDQMKSIEKIFNALISIRTKIEDNCIDNSNTSSQDDRDSIYNFISEIDYLISNKSKDINSFQEIYQDNMEIIEKFTSTFNEPRSHNIKELSSELEQEMLRAKLELEKNKKKKKKAEKAKK